MDDYELEAEELREAQWERATRCAQQLAGDRATRGIVKAMFELVAAVERGEDTGGGRSGPAPGARQVLKPRKKPKKTEPAAPVAGEPVQEVLW